MINTLKCLLGIHSYTVISNIDIAHPLIKDLQTAHIIISRCTHCGKIKTVRIKLINENEII